MVHTGVRPELLGGRTNVAGSAWEVAILRPGGRLVAADLVRVGALPAEILADPMAMATSLGGVMEETDLLAVIENAGLNNVAITGHRPFGPVIAVNISATR